MAAGIGVPLLTAIAASRSPDWTYAAAVALIGVPVGIICGWIFAPAIVTTSRLRLIPLVVAISAIAVLLGWLGGTGMILTAALLLGPIVRGDTLTAGSLISVAALLEIAPALPLTIAIVAAWATVVRIVTAWRQRTTSA
jgi:hypothetical protein